MVTKIIKSRGPAKIVRILVDKKKIVTSDEPYKPLTIALKKRTARNSQGRITIRFRANPVHRRLYRLIDFYRLDKKNIPAKIETIEYDPNRSAFIALVCYADGERRYHLLADGLTTGNEIICGDDVEAKPGNRLPLKNINPGSEVFEIELTPNSGGKLVRSAGSAAILLGFENNYALLKMPSGEIRKIHQECYATVGRVSNTAHRLERLGKAGRNIWKGRRPKVRGSAMNPRDHPYGGGEGRALRGTRKPKDKWGNVTGGRKTRKKRKPSTKLIVKRRR